LGAGVEVGVAVKEEMTRMRIMRRKRKRKLSNPLRPAPDILQRLAHPARERPASDALQRLSSHVRVESSGGERRLGNPTRSASESIKSVGSASDSTKSVGSRSTAGDGDEALVTKVDGLATQVASLMGVMSKLEGVEAAVSKVDHMAAVVGQLVSIVKALETSSSRSAPAERVGQEGDGVGKTVRSAASGGAPVAEVDAHVSEVGVEAEAARLQAARLELDVIKRKEADRRLSNAGSIWQWHKEARLVVGIEEVRNIYIAVVGRFGTTFV